MTFPTLLSPCVLNPGNYDGVHLGHQALLARAGQIAAARQMALVVLTFDPHPAAVMAPDRAPTLLTTHPRRAEMLKALGVNRVIVHPFDKEFASIDPEFFIRSFLVEKLKVGALVVGPDFCFGKNRRGNVTLLRKFAESLHYSVEPQSPVEFEGEVVSSSRIRALLAEGEVARAAALLGRVHDVGAEVVEGDKRGRRLGFPTANLRCEPVQLPSDGVYAVIAHLQSGERVWGVANLGTRPTFEAGRSIEAHFFKFDGDLYGQTLRIGFVARLREERRFEDLKALTEQIKTDCDQGRQQLLRTDARLLQWV